MKALLITLLTSSALCAQGLHVVPRGHASAEGDAMLAMPGISTADRVQIIIAGSELTELSGKQLTGIVLRRDTSHTGALAQAQGQVVVRIGLAASSPESAARGFAVNLPQSVEVYRGAITAPASPASPAGPSWSAQDSAALQFTTGFHYTGGPLCIELEALANAATWWPVDAKTDPAGGQATSIGASCGSLQDWVETAGVFPAGLVIGRTATFYLNGGPRNPAWLLLGFRLLPQSLDLGPFGAPGCWLHVDPITAMPSVLSDGAAGFAGQGLANVHLHLPVDTGLFGARFAAQWVELQGATFSTSNAIDCQIASIPPTVPMTLVAARANELPTVRSAAVPILGIVWQD
jgi:hypothetical protein